MKTTSAQKRTTTRRVHSTKQSKMPPSIQTNELGVLLEEIKNYICSLTQAHEQLNQSLKPVTERNS